MSTPAIPPPGGEHLTPSELETFDVLRRNDRHTAEALPWESIVAYYAALALPAYYAAHPLPKGTPACPPCSEPLAK